MSGQSRTKHIHVSEENNTLVPEVFLDFSTRERDQEQAAKRQLRALRGLLLISFAKKNQEKPLGPG